MRGRVMELEERLDFTERMISKAREPERINGRQLDLSAMARVVPVTGRQGQW